MKRTGTKTLQSCVSLLLVLCMILSIMPMNALATGIGSEDKPIVYVSIGDSMTNGYCLDGYDGTSGAVNYGMETYGNKFAAWLAGYTGPIANDQVIFVGANATVDHRQLSISGLRAQDIHWILEMNYTDETLMQNIFNMDYNGTGWNAENWYDNWGLYGDRYTWSEYGDYDYRYADAAARILAMYHGGNGTGYFTSSYTDDATVQKAIAGITADPYYPQGKGQADEMGGYKYLQVATEFYQKSMADADIISLAVGNTNFGTHMLSNITDVIMAGDMSFSSQYSIDRAMALAAMDPFAEAKVSEMLTSEAFANIVGACKYLAGGDTAKEAEIGYIVEYCMISFITGYIGMLNSILELNPDAEIIQIALMNAYENQDGTVEEGTLGELVHLIYTPVNQFLRKLSGELMASKSTEDQAKYADATFYFAEADYVSCMVDVFGDDYYMEDGSFVEYPGLLDGTEGYTANQASIVRNRFVEEIICGDMIFNAMGLKKYNTQENLDHFLWGGEVLDKNGNKVYEGVGAVAYDMMTLTQKAGYAAQNADAAKEYALYLAFENSLIRSGTENVTMEALAGLSNIQSAFLAFYPEVLAAIGNARAAYYEAVAPVIVAGSNGSLTEDQVVEIMAAYEGVKAAVWNGFADYHEALAAATGHTTLEHVINCDTCMGGDCHNNEIAKNLVATYNDQMDLLPYSIVAETIKEQTNGLLTGEDVRKLCKTADTATYTDVVYALVREKAAEMGYEFTDEDIDLLLEEDGEYKIAGQIAGQDWNTVKTLYEKNLILTDDQRAGIDMLKQVRAGVVMLLNGETEGQLKNGAAGIRSAIDGAAQLAYLLALPQAMSDSLYNDSNMQGALCMDARCLLGTGAGGHPSVGGHTALYNAVLDAYVQNVSYDWSEDYSTCTATLNGRFCADAEVTSDVTASATCEEMGTTTYTAVFDVPWAETQMKSVKNIPTSDHTYSDLIPAQEAVHSKEELTGAVAAHYFCEVCGTYFTEDKEATNLEALTGETPVHSYGDWISTDGNKHWKECSCGLKSEEGDHIYDDDQDAVCDTCGHSREIHICGSLTHVEAKNATCMADGNTEYWSCACGKLYADAEAKTEITDKNSVVISKDENAHNMQETAARVEPTCSAEGKTAVLSCANGCGHTEGGEPIKKLDHEYGEDGKCHCGAVDPNAHPVCEYTVEETLTSGNTYILSLGGTQVGFYTFTQVEGGWTILAADGTFLAIEDKDLVNSASAFTWTYANGSFRAVIETKSSNNWWGGIFGGWWGSGSSEETYYLVASDSGVGISTSASGSEAAFYTAHSDSSHNFDSGVVTDPTCTEDGCTTYTCERCGYSYTGNPVSASGHSYTASVTDPTCTKDGYTTYTCDACGDSYTGDPTDATGHNMVDGACTSCGHTEGSTEPPVVPEEGECTYLAGQSLTSGETYVLTLGGNNVGNYTFTQISGGWAIQTADGIYLALDNGALAHAADPFAWTYSNGRFSAESKSASSNNWWGNWWGSRSTTYYLVSAGSAVTVSTSTSNASAAFYQQVTGNHVYSDPVADNGSHVYTCVNCGSEKAVSCTDADCELCHPAVPEASIRVSVEVTSTSSGSSWWDRFFGSSKKTYTAAITVEAEGTEVKSVAYSTDGGSSWTEGASFTSSNNITAFDIRVEATNGQTYYFTYSNGTVTETA